MLGDYSPYFSNQRTVMETRTHKLLTAIFCIAFTLQAYKEQFKAYQTDYFNLFVSPVFINFLVSA